MPTLKSDGLLGGSFFLKEKNMFTAEQCRAKAIEYSKLLRIASGADEAREYHRLERSFTELADNAQWLTDNHSKTPRATARETALVALVSVDSATQINSQQ
ncbi:MAG: hypothetical protein WBE99_06355 [Xanthobacteraceae bacterium]